ncbi:MAG: FAD-dependent monooxygenase, partial [Acidimicrobiales bacterium]
EGMEFGMLRIAGDRTTWFGVVSRFDDGGSKAELLRRFARFHSPVTELLEATPEEAIWRDDIDDLWPLRQWSKGPVALLGDAAHAMTPAFGLGACHAILDAEAIAAALASDADPSRAFRAYQRARQRRVRAVTMVARAGVAGPHRDFPQRLVAAGLGAVPDGAFLAGLAAVTAG